MQTQRGRSQRGDLDVGGYVVVVVVVALCVDALPLPFLSCCRYRIQGSTCTYPIKRKLFTSFPLELNLIQPINKVWGLKRNCTFLQFLQMLKSSFRSNELIAVCLDEYSIYITYRTRRRTILSFNCNFQCR